MTKPLNLDCWSSSDCKFFCPSFCFKFEIESRGSSSSYTTGSWIKRWWLVNLEIESSSILSSGSNLMCSSSIVLEAASSSLIVFGYLQLCRFPFIAIDEVEAVSLPWHFFPFGSIDETYQVSVSDIRSKWAVSFWISRWYLMLCSWPRI